MLVATAEQKDVPIYLDALGTVQAFNTVTVKPMVDGPLNAVNFTEGQDVKKGDVLAQIDPRTYQAALDQATAKKAQDEAQLANARLDLARYTKLAANNYSSGQQADTAKAQVAQLEALVNQDQAQIDNARTLLGYTTITSPLDGRTGMRQVDAGNIVHASDTTGMVVITQLHPISVVFTLPQQTLAQVSRAMAQGAAKVLAYAQGAIGGQTGTLDTGTLTVLDNQVDPTTGTIKLKATFPNPENRLWPGAFVGVQVQVDTAKDAIVVPPAAVQRGPRSAFVYVVESRQLDDATQRQGRARGRAGVDHHRGSEDRGEGGDRWSVAAERRQQGDDRAAGAPRTVRRRRTSRQRPGRGGGGPGRRGDHAPPPPGPLPQGEGEDCSCTCSPSPCGRGLGGGVAHNIR